MENKETILKLSRNLPPWWLVFIVPESIRRLMGKKIHQSYSVLESEYYNMNLPGKTYPGMLWDYGIRFLIECEAYSTVENFTPNTVILIKNSCGGHKPLGDLGGNCYYFARCCEVNSCSHFLCFLPISVGCFHIWSEKLLLHWEAVTGMESNWSKP